MDDLESLNSNELFRVGSSGLEIFPATDQFTCVIHGINLTVGIVNDFPALQLCQSNVFKLDANCLHITFVFRQRDILSIKSSWTSDVGIEAQGQGEVFLIERPAIFSQFDATNSPSSFRTKISRQTRQDILVGVFRVGFGDVWGALGEPRNSIAQCRKLNSVFVDAIPFFKDNEKIDSRIREVLISSVKISIQVTSSGDERTFAIFDAEICCTVKSKS